MVGAGVGAVAAFMAGSPRPPPAAPRAPEPRLVVPRASSAAPVAPREPVASSAPAVEAPAPTAPPAPSAPPPQAEPKAQPSELDQLPTAELEKRCAFRQPKACLASARAFDSGREVTRDAAKARVYRALAVSLLDERCLARDAESCHDLAGLYQAGSGVEKNPATASALTQRARELCAGKTSSFCERLGVGAKIP